MAQRKDNYYSVAGDESELKILRLFLDNGWLGAKFNNAGADLLVSKNGKNLSLISVKSFDPKKNEKDTIYYIEKNHIKTYENFAKKMFGDIELRLLFGFVLGILNNDKKYEIRMIMDIKSVKELKKSKNNELFKLNFNEKYWNDLKQKSLFFRKYQALPGEVNRINCTELIFT